MATTSLTNVLAKLEQGTTGAKVLLVICTIVTGTILLLELWGIAEEYRSGNLMKMNRTNKTFRVLMFLQNLCVFAIGICGCVGYYNPFIFNQPACDMYSQALSGLYAVATMLFWIFLIKKVLLVSKYERSILFKIMFFLACLLAFVYWPFVKIPLNAVYYTGAILPNGVCVPGKSRTPVVLQLMVACNIAFMLLSTGLFVAPLMSSTKINSEGRPVILRTVRKTIILSSIGTFFTTVALVNMLIAVGGSDQETVILFSALSLGYHILSLTVDSVCSHIMTTVWMPELMKQKLGYMTAASDVLLETNDGVNKFNSTSNTHPERMASHSKGNLYASSGQVAAVSPTSVEDA